MSSVITFSSQITSTSSSSYYKSPAGIARICIIVFEAAFCITFPFLLETPYWSNWKYMSSAYSFYLATGVMSCVFSIIIFVITAARLWSKVTFWALFMIIFDVIFLIFAVVNGIAFAVLASDYRYVFAIVSTGAYVASSIFNFFAAVAYCVDLFIWTRPTVNI